MMKSNLFNFKVAHVCEPFPHHKILLEIVSDRRSLDGWDARQDSNFFLFLFLPYLGRAEAAIVGHEILPPTH